MAHGMFGHEPSPPSGFFMPLRRTARKQLPEPLVRRDLRGWSFRGRMVAAPLKHAAGP